MSASTMPTRSSRACPICGPGLSLACSKTARASGRNGFSSSMRIGMHMPGPNSTTRLDSSASKCSPDRTFLPDSDLAGETWSKSVAAILLEIAVDYEARASRAGPVIDGERYPNILKPRADREQLPYTPLLVHHSWPALPPCRRPAVE